MPLYFLTFKNDGPVKVPVVTRPGTLYREGVWGLKLDESGESEVPEKTIPTPRF